MCSPQRCLIVGLDGATLDLVEPWVQAGRLPTLGRILAEGSYGPLRSVVPPMTAPAWMSFMTGKNPGRHGLIDWIARDVGAYSASPVTAEDAAEPTLWDILSQRGRRVCVYNVPMTYPPRPVNGILISGLPAPNKAVPLTYPAHWQAELDRLAGGEYILYPDPGRAYSDQGVAAFTQHLFASLESRLNLFEHLYRQEAWDVFMLVFNGTDTAQHALWKFLDPRHPLYRPTLAARYGDVVLRVYQRLDRWLGELLPTLGPETTLWLMSDHGFGPLHHFLHVNNWLRQAGFLHLAQTPRARFKGWLFARGFTPMAIYNGLMRLGLGALKREVVRGRGQGWLSRLFLSFQEVDWARTQAYSLGNVGQIYINLQGREPQGCVAPGAEYEAVRDRLITALRELRDPVTGEQVVEHIYRREELYQGAQLQRLPDILFLPTRLEYFGFGEFEFGSRHLVERVERGISGTHRMNGLVAAWGEPIRAGGRPQAAQLIDLAPTILHLLGEAIPRDMDGRVLHEMLTGAWSRPELVRWSEPTAWSPAAAREQAALSPEQTEALRQRFRDLGYAGPT